MFEANVKKELDQQGLCRKDRSPELWEAFFAETALERRPARNLCGEYGHPTSCPVRELCLKWALENKEIWGIWGGLDESELRRALWVDADGEPTARCRYPNCPNCKARPDNLYVLSVCELKTGKTREQVSCLRCGFTWKAATSVQAVKAYWRDRQRKIRARAVKGRLPDARPLRVLLGSGPLPVPTAAPKYAALAASAAPVA
jgi:transcription elongation factor Elf1